MSIPIILQPAEVQHRESAERWALASIMLDAGTLVETDAYGGSEAAILEDVVWFTHYLIALARLTLEGRQIVNAARGDDDRSSVGSCGPNCGTGTPQS